MDGWMNGWVCVAVSCPALPCPTAPALLLPSSYLAPFDLSLELFCRVNVVYY
jgi:hypothetical protein